MKTKFNEIKQLKDLEIVEGIKYCLDNSNELYKSAIILKDNNTFSTSISLLILSVEELMKSFALYSLLFLEIEDREVFREIFESNNLHSNRHNALLYFNEFFKSFDFKELKELDKLNNHTEESVSNILIEKINLENVAKNVNLEKNSLNNWFLHANTNKNSGFYVAYNKKWFSPNRLTKKDFVNAHRETELIRNILNDFLLNFVSKENNEIILMIKNLKSFSENFMQKK